MKQKALIRLERKMVTAMIIDTDFLRYAEPIIEPRWIQSNDARTLVTWVFDYFNKYKKAPGLDIQEIYEDQLDRGKLGDDQAEMIEFILEDLSSEVEDWDPESLGYLKDRVIDYADICKLRGLSEEIENLVDSGDIKDARDTARGYRPVELMVVRSVEPLATDEQLDAVFAEKQKPLIHYPGVLGQVIDPHMIRQGFVIYLAQNKGGKSFHLMDAGIRAAGQGKKVLICQAGDMSQVQMERRIAIYNTMISDRIRYCGNMLIPVIDCQHNQLGTCEKSIRTNGDDEGPFEDMGNRFLEEKVTFADYQQAFDDLPGYKPCQECRRNPKQSRFFKGAVWYKRRSRIDPLDKPTYINIKQQAAGKFNSPFHAMKNIRIGTHSNESLSMEILERELDLLADKEKFEPDIVIADYLDLFMPDSDTKHLNFRDQENKKWQRGRRISQDRDLLFISASQSDAQGFNKKLLDKSNFSEDRRKLDHVSAMFGLNMTITEKMMGVMRMNEIVARETEGTAIVHVLHRLQIGRPILGSYF